MKRLTLKKLKEICKESGACCEGMAFLEDCKTLKEARLKAPPEYIEWVLSYHPYLAERCTRDDWDKLNGPEWGWLLIKQPQLAEYCTRGDWSKLDGYNWWWLLRYQPQLDKYREEK